MSLDPAFTLSQGPELRESGCVWQELSPAEPSPWPIMCILKRLMAKHLSTLMWRVLPVVPAGGWLCRVGQRFARLIVHK